MIRRPAVLLLLLAASACSPEDVPKQAPVVGGDVDQHGCKASAGYRWCEKTARCERPWELAAAQNFENTSTAFKAFCSVNAQ